MAERKIIFLLFISLLVLLTAAQFRDNYASGTANTTANSNTDISTGSGDLKVGSCDISCCCDTDCPAETLKLWEADATAFCNSVIFEELKPETRCIDRDYIAFTNKRMGITIDDNDSKPEICVSRDDSNDSDSFDEIKFDTQNSTEDLIVFNRWFDWIDTSDDPEVFTTGDNILYNKGDAIQKMDDTRKLPTALKFPSLGSYGNGEFDSQAVFGVDSEFTGYYKLTSATTECPAFFSSLYYSNLKICTAGNCLQTLAVTVPSTLTPAAAGNDCANRITSLEFIYRLSNNSASGFMFSSVQMNYDTTAVALINGQVAELKVKTRFLSANGTNSEKSGNPGYQSGEKLLLKLASSTTIGYSKEITGSGTNKGSLTIPTQNVNIDYVTFNEVANLQCEVTYADSAALQTAGTQTDYQKYSAFNQFDQFGRYGDAEEKNQWTNIITTSTTTSPSFSGSTGSNMITGIEYEILYSRKGYQNNLHSYIISLNSKPLQEDITFVNADTAVPFRVAFTYYYIDP